MGFPPFPAMIAYPIMTCVGGFRSVENPIPNEERARLMVSLQETERAEQ